MKATEIRKKTIAENQILLKEELRTQFNLRMRKGAGQIESPSDIKKNRRNIARIKTIINQQKCEEANG